LLGGFVVKPLIGINCEFEVGPPRRACLQANYYEAITRAGGIPVLLAPMSDQDLTELLGQLHGVLLTGGPDYCPSLYSEAAHDRVQLVANDRQDFDIKLVRQAVSQPRLPILGICAGAQLMNISLGGTLVQDIPSHLPDSQVEHSSTNGWAEGFSEHAVKLEAASKLAGIYRTVSLSVPTSHHQSVKDLGSGLTIAAYADDGIIEAVELQDKPFVIGVQWHPERDFEGNKKLFEEFVRHAAVAETAAAK
jgi:gamma-glutamyl-gamma-aminobutyrate hydrolase PuuD